MTFDLYRNISDTDAQFFVGGNDTYGEGVANNTADNAHGLFPNHQAHNNPGDTATDRHNFADDVLAGDSNQLVQYTNANISGQ